MLKGNINEINIEGDIQNCYNNTFAIIDKVATLAASEKSQKKSNEVVALAVDVNTFFSKIANFEEISLKLRTELKRSECTPSEILSAIKDLGKQWKDSQYSEFSTRAESIIQELLPIK